jgi:methyltransferase (TIGR00027 family)
MAIRDHDVERPRRRQVAHSCSTGPQPGGDLGRAKEIVGRRPRASIIRCSPGTPQASGQTSVMEAVSQTAIFAAQVRAAHAVLDRDPIFEDTYAMVLADTSEEDIRALFDHIPPRCARVARVLPNQRARFVDEQVEQAVRLGIGQYVILGAGLDSFAWRRTDLMADLELFEVDHPETQRWKRRRMGVAGLPHPSNLHFVGLDFEAHESVSDQLSLSGFDKSRPSIWSWLGVAVYLGIDAITSMLRDTAELAASGSRFVGSYVVTSDLMDADSREFADLARAASAESGEEHVSAFAPEHIESIVNSAGWRNTRSVDPSSFEGWFSQRGDGLTSASYEWLFVAEK